MGNPNGMMGNLLPTDGTRSSADQVVNGADDGVLSQDMGKGCRAS
jgi:hypothetical protein